MFCGGLDVAINVKTKKKIANDINHFVIEIMQLFQEESIDELLEKIDQVILENNLSKENKDSYYEFREKYNNNKDPLSLYVLVCYSFNYQFRFNSDLDYNNPAGTNRSSFNDNMRKRLVDFTNKIEDIQLLTKHFKDLDLSILGKNDLCIWSTI